ncbi:methyltransferase domain-containing protein [Streptomyces sp. NBC_00059]|uniref:methyltransferase domain-containing protein n=1 Tax=Streptomyces sp. NBC_00059 TaxID=2975635 RepID=UPI00224FE3B4|nr:methyltransferase domain-containing protein [Streptomyces sp. NBC_00059]MCX5418076.1 methyltransferase domain-containing protein [Streptomyces sp. NBC_00059]
MELALRPQADPPAPPPCSTGTRDCHIGPDPAQPGGQAAPTRGNGDRLPGLRPRPGRRPARLDHRRSRLSRRTLRPARRRLGQHPSHRPRRPAARRPHPRRHPPQRPLPGNRFRHRPVHPRLATAFTSVLSLDLSEQMLHQATGRSPARVRADASALPVADASIAAVAAIDMLLFPTETARVLAPGGVLLWINQLGQDGPLYLSAEEVTAALPGLWTAREAEAGWGTWALLRRLSP